MRAVFSVSRSPNLPAADARCLLRVPRVTLCLQLVREADSANSTGGMFGNTLHALELIVYITLGGTRSSIFSLIMYVGGASHPNIHVLWRMVIGHQFIRAWRL